MLSALVLFSLLLSAQATWFPEGRCYMPTCEPTPYDLTWVSQTQNGANTIACFLVTAKPCIDSNKFGCCSVFSNQLFKIVLSSRPACDKKVLSVYKNNTKLNGGVYFDTYHNQHSELRLTHLLIPGSKASGTMFCLTLAPPCNSIADFCIEEKSGLCKFSIYDSGAHVCCPVCYMLDKSFLQ